MTSKQKGEKKKTNIKFNVQTKARRGKAKESHTFKSKQSEQRQTKGYQSGPQQDLRDEEASDPHHEYQ